MILSARRKRVCRSNGPGHSFLARGRLGSSPRLVGRTGQPGRRQASDCARQPAWSNELCRRRYLSSRVATKATKFELEDGMMGLGRDSSNLIQVHDTEVSRRHAEIRREGDAYTVVDLGSSNGTFVNGERVEQHELASGDRLQVGSTLMLFTDPGDAAEDLSDKIDIVLRSHAARRLADRPLDDASRKGADVQTARRRPAEPLAGPGRSNLQIMYRTALAVSHTQDIDQLLTRIMQLIFDWVEADRGCVMLMDEETKQLEPKVQHDRARHRHRRKADDQQDDSGLRHPAQRGRADQRRPRR